MKKRKGIPDLSKPEYEILRILWEKGKQSVREVQNQLHSDLHWAYTTTKTIMDRMTNKHYLKRENFHGVNVYSPLISRTQGLAGFIQFFAERILEMDAGIVISLFSKKNILNDKEIDELTALIENYKKEQEQ